MALVFGSSQGISSEVEANYSLQLYLQGYIHKLLGASLLFSGDSNV